MATNSSHKSLKGEVGCLSDRFHRDGYVVLRNALKPATVTGLVAQLSSELRCEPIPILSQPSSPMAAARSNKDRIGLMGDMGRKTSEIRAARATMAISAERNFGRVDLQDPSTWPNRGAPSRRA